MKAEIGRAAARGVIAAMAMTGVRRVSVGLGLVHQAPPEEIAEHGVPHIFDAIPSEYRDEAIELAHWAYGGLAGAAFGALPQAARRSTWAGPVYGLASWAFFERLLARLLGLREPQHRARVERALIAADHALYGAVVGGRLAPREFNGSQRPAAEARFIRARGSLRRGNA